MRGRRFARGGWLTVAALAASAFVATGVAAGASTAAWVTVTKDFESPLFGLNLGSGHTLLVADAGAGPTRVTGGTTSLITALPGVTDVAQMSARGGDLWALTSEFAPGATQTLWRISNGTATMVADLLAFETAVDPADDGVESNPFDLAPTLHGKTYIADAAGNSILIADVSGRVDWVAALPQNPVSTSPLKRAVGCPHGPPDICGLPETLEADPVATSVAIGPDGYIYVGELTGFPATPGTSRIWRIAPGTLHAKCGVDPACQLVGTGFTSIIDIAFGPDGTMYVVELDEASWLAMEMGLGVGGTVNACTGSGTTWVCTPKATGLPMPTAVAIDRNNVYVTLFSLVEGEAQVARLN